MSRAINIRCRHCEASIKEGANFCTRCGLSLIGETKRSPRIRLGWTKWLVIGTLAVFLWFACTVYEELSYYPEPDTDTTPVHLRNLEAKEYMLQLVNEARIQEGSPPVTLGTNNAAQLHAEQGVEECTTSHWDKYGLKPYMRYSLAGGSNNNGENIGTYFNCVDGETETPFSWSVHFDHKVDKAVEVTVENLLESPGHRETMLHPDYSIMNAGIAWNKQAFNVVQLFETDFVEFGEGPELTKGVLTMTGRTKQIPEFSKEHSLLVVVTYDPPLVRLGPNQLARTSCYSNGDPILLITDQPPKGKTYAETSLEFETETGTCPDPYQISRKIRAPTSLEEVERLGERAKRAEKEKEVTITMERVEANIWKTDESEFHLEADLSGHLEDQGIYTMIMLAFQENGEEFIIAEKSFFHEVTPPSYYQSNQ